MSKTVMISALMEFTFPWVERVGRIEQQITTQLLFNFNYDKPYKFQSTPSMEI